MHLGASKSGRATLPRGDELRKLVRQRIGSDDSPSPPSSGKEGAVEEPSSSSRSEVDMEKVELPVRGVPLRDFLCQRMGSDDSPMKINGLKLTVSLYCYAVFARGFYD